jgi:predicted ester cyclase
MPDGLAVQTHVVAENDRVASISLWDGTVTASGQAVDFASADFLRIENGVAAEHWTPSTTCASTRRSGSSRPTCGAFPS